MQELIQQFSDECEQHAYDMMLRLLDHDTATPARRLAAFMRRTLRTWYATKIEPPLDSDMVVLAVASADAGVSRCLEEVELTRWTLA